MRWLLLLCACGPTVGSSDDGIETDFAPTTEATTTTGSGGSDDGGGDTECGGGGKCDVGHTGCPWDDELPPVDVLIVVDNSVSMADEQAHVSRNVLGFVHRLRALSDASGQPVDLDAHLMVTTTDFGGPLCGETPGYAPARGAPVTDGCNARLAEFTTATRNVEDACTSVCPQDVVSGTSYIAWGPTGTNVPDVPPIDVDGDGEMEDAVDRAVACIGAQGIVGCEYEAPLEAMLQALDPAAEWNQGPEPFLREGAVLFAVIITDELDCSAQDPAFVLDDAYMEVDPNTSQRAPSSASCWNAGVGCQGPDAAGYYTGCAPIEGPLHDIDRYVSYLQETFEDRVVVGIVGAVPEVTMHDVEAPYHPVEGGVLDLVYRRWQDGAYPEGSLLPADDAAGVTADEQQFRFGIGPGCTTETRQGTPPARLSEFCDAVGDEDAPRCWIESICDDDFSTIAHALLSISIAPGVLVPCG
jgi:hypothetical protein